MVVVLVVVVVLKFKINFKLTSSSTSLVGTMVAPFRSLAFVVDAPCVLLRRDLLRRGVGLSE